MRYIYIDGFVIPKHCKFGPRPAEGIVFNNMEWWSITDHLVKEQREKEYADVLKAKEKNKQIDSNEMTRNWRNTYASLKTQGLEKRRANLEKEKQDKIDRYHQILEGWKQERKEKIEDVKKAMYEERSTARELTRAMFLCSVLKERQNQIDLEKQIKIRKIKEDLEEVEKYKREAEEFAREKLQDKIIEQERKKRQREFLDAQVKDNKIRKMEEEDFAQQQQDLKNMLIELEQVKNCMNLEKKYRRDLEIRYLTKSQNQVEYLRNMKLEEEEENYLNKIYEDYARRIKKERKEREQKALERDIGIRMKMSEKLALKLEAARKKEEELVMNAIREKDEEAKREEERKEQLRQEMIADRRDFKKKTEERRARERYEKKEREKWELIMAYRNMEETELWKKAEIMRKKKWQAQNRAAFDIQIKEHEERKAEELREALMFQENEAAEKQQLLQYLERGLECVKKKDVPMYPVLKAIANIKKANGLATSLEVKGLEKPDDNCNRKPKVGVIERGCYCLKY